MTVPNAAPDATPNASPQATGMPAILTPLPRPVPGCANARLALFAIRRMGAHGLADANAAHALFNGFGEAFRRPLVLMRALMADMAGAADGSITIAPCCCGRLTAAESAMLTVLARVEQQPESARLLLADLLGIRRVDGVLTSAAAVAMAFADAGRPIRG